MVQEKAMNADFAELVQKTREQQHIEERKKRKKPSDDIQVDKSILSNDNNQPEKTKRQFRQREVLSTQHGEGEAQLFDPDLVGKIFARKLKKKAPTSDS